MVETFSPEINWGHVKCVDLGYDEITIGGM